MQKSLEEKPGFQVITSMSTIAKLEADYIFPIYDPQNFFEGMNNLKGGKRKQNE